MRLALLWSVCFWLCACSLTGRDLRPTLTAKEYADARTAFIAALRARAGEDAVDCGFELEDAKRRDKGSVSSVAVCVRNAWESRRPFFVFEEGRLYCPQFSGYAASASGKVWRMSICPDRNRDMGAPQRVEEFYCDDFEPPDEQMLGGSCSVLDRI